MIWEVYFFIIFNYGVKSLKFSLITLLFNFVKIPMYLDNENDNDDSGCGGGGEALINKLKKLMSLLFFSSF